MGMVSSLSDYFKETLDSIRSIQLRQLLLQLITLGMIVSMALIMWKGLICFTGSESPVVVVLSGSMEPGFQRGDILFLNMGSTPVRAGEIVVFNVDGRKIPIVHRVIKVHQDRDTGEVDVLTKGDNNDGDDRLLYADGQMWLNDGSIGWLSPLCWLGNYLHDRETFRKVHPHSSIRSTGFGFLKLYAAVILVTRIWKPKVLKLCLFL